MIQTLTQFLRHCHGQSHAFYNNPDTIKSLQDESIVIHVEATDDVVLLIAALIAYLADKGGYTGHLFY